MRLPVVFLVALISSAAAPAGPPLAGQERGDTRLEQVFTPETLAALRSEIEKAERASLPTEPLVQKALEGRSKGAPDDRVVAAVSALLERLETAARVLGRDAEEAALVAAAAALYLGVRADGLEAVVTETPDEAVAMALVVLGDLVTRGVEAETAHDVMLSLGKVGADAATLAEFRERVEADIVEGVAPGRAALVRSRGVVVTLGGGGKPGGGGGT